ncbi:MAG: hypothetical protein U0324_31505 [Polyangiales bacterium]
MKHKAPDTEVELAQLIDLTLMEVPLRPAEVREVEKETGIDMGRFADRLRARITLEKERAVRAKFEEAESSRRAAVRNMEQQLAQPRRLSADQARARLHELRARGGAAVEAHFHKLDRLSEADLNRLVEEFEALFNEKRG